MKMSNYLKLLYSRTCHNSTTSFKYLLLSRNVCSTSYNKQTLSTNTYNIPSILRSKIKMSGPVTVAEFMKAVLTSPVSGYYMNKDVFGTQGDFITSPEISQLFGEMVALWVINEWSRIGSPKPMQIIELGPGRGTMMSDILRIFHRLELTSDVSCCLVEVSPELSRLQANVLCPKTEEQTGDSRWYRRGQSRSGVPVYWYHSLEDVPRQFSCVVAHEFFDALPIHKFQKTEDGWREILIDIDPAKPNSFRYVISRMPTPASTVLLKKEEKRDHVEICPQAGVMAQALAERLEEDGGIALIADYGHSGDKTDTFRGFKKHELHNPLQEPGSADLTADVDFRFLRDAVSQKLVCFGPVTQRHFLMHMHVEKRLETLISNCKNEADISVLKSGFHMMTDEDKMGLCFKFLAMYPLVLKDFLTDQPPPGFI